MLGDLAHLPAVGADTADHNQPADTLAIVIAPDDVCLRWPVPPIPTRPPRTGAFYQQWLPFLSLTDMAYWNTELQESDS